MWYTISVQHTKEGAGTRETALTIQSRNTARGGRKPILSTLSDIHVAHKRGGAWGGLRPPCCTIDTQQKASVDLDGLLMRDPNHKDQLEAVIRAPLRLRAGAAEVARRSTASEKPGRSHSEVDFTLT